MTPEEWERLREIGPAESWIIALKRLWRLVALFIGLVVTLLLTPQAQKIADWVNKLIFAQPQSTQQTEKRPWHAKRLILYMESPTSAAQQLLRADAVPVPLSQALGTRNGIALS